MCVYISLSLYMYICIHMYIYIYTVEGINVATLEQYMFKKT